MLLVLGTVGLVALHVLYPGPDELDQPISDYADGAGAPLLFVTYAVFAAAGALLGVAILGRAESDRRMRLVARLLFVGGASFALLIVWWTGTAHRVVLAVGLGALFGAVLLLTLRRDRVRGTAWLGAISWPVLAIMALNAMRVQRFLPWNGIIERGYFLALIAWGFAVASAQADPERRRASPGVAMTTGVVK